MPYPLPSTQSSHTLKTSRGWWSTSSAVDTISPATLKNLTFWARLPLTLCGWILDFFTSEQTPDRTDWQSHFNCAGGPCAQPPPVHTVATWMHSQTWREGYCEVVKSTVLQIGAIHSSTSAKPRRCWLLIWERRRPRQTTVYISGAEAEQVNSFRLLGFNIIYHPGR